MYFSVSKNMFRGLQLARELQCVALICVLRSTERFFVLRGLHKVCEPLIYSVSVLVAFFLKAMQTQVMCESICGKARSRRRRSWEDVLSS